MQGLVHKKYLTYLHDPCVKIYTVKHHIARFEKRGIQINRQRSVFKKFVIAFCPVNRAYINLLGLIYC